MICRMAVWWGVWLLLAASANGAQPAGYPGAVSVEGQTLSWVEQESWIGYGQLGAWNLTGIAEFNSWTLNNGMIDIGTYRYDTSSHAWTGEGPVIADVPEPSSTMQIVGLAGFFLMSSRALGRRCFTACPRRCW